VSARELEHVHFIAIGGTGMGSLAGLLKARGIRVTGSDRALYPPMSTALEDWGIPVVEGFRPENVLADRPDLVVIGNAVRPDNPEARAAIDAGLEYRSFSDALYELAMAQRHSVVIAGTHGKTTTTSLLAYLLHATGRDPSLLVGGISLDFGGSFREGEGEHFVVEGDEYDTAFFDKTPKFLHYHPQTLQLTSVEFDHADIYRDLDHVKSAFRELMRAMPADGQVVAAGCYANVVDVLGDAACEVRRYGVVDGKSNDGEHSGAAPLDWRASRLDATPEGTRFAVQGSEGQAASALLPLYGRANVENALGALAVLDRLDVPLAEAVEALPRYQGVKRRQELRGEVRGVAVIDDFAHHPTAVRETIAALRSQYRGRRLIAVFEPRTNTSRRAVFQRDYARAFDEADRTIVKRVPDEPIYSATGEVSELFSADTLADSLRERGLDCRVYDEVDEIVDALAKDAREGDVVLTMSNGAFGGIWEKLLAALQ